MRAILLKEITDANVGEKLSVEGDVAKHLVKVVRIKKGENVLVMNGQGLIAKSLVCSVEKKSAVLEVLEVDRLEKRSLIDLAICTPKKDAMEDIIRDCVELGVEKLFPINSQYSQLNLEVNDRINRILESGAIQANNPFLLEISEMKDLSFVKEIASEYEQVIYCSSRPIESSKTGKLSGKTLIVIGPEAGLAKEEENFLSEIENSLSIHFPSYILRAPTAVNVAAGFVFSKLH